MKKRILIISIGVIAIMFILAKLLDNGLYVKLEKIREVQVDKVLGGDYWILVVENGTEYLKRFNLDPLDYDLTSYNIVISEGREIVKMKYKRARTFPFKPTNYTKTVLGKELHQNTLFIYKIDKKHMVRLDERGWNMDIDIQK